MMTRAERAAEAAELRARGLLYREIAERMGISISYAQDLISDPDGSRVRARKDSYRGACEICGKATDGSAGRGAAPRFCNRCSAAHHPAKLAQYERAHAPIQARDRQLEKWWAEGLTRREIAARLGWSEGHVNVEIHRARERGAHLPYRYTTGKRAGRRFSGQVAS
jgi:transposase